jgi:hypothetical protein
MATTPPQTFQWGPGGRAMTPREVAEARAVAQALAGQRSKVAQNPWEGIAQVANAWSERQWREQAAAAEEAGMAEAGGLFGGLTSSSPQADIIAALNTPWASETQSSVARALLGDQMEANDPMNQLRLAQAQLDYDQDLAGIGGSAASFSQTPVFLVDDAGNQHAAQMSSGGGIYVNGEVLPGIPAGWKIVARPETLNTLDLGGSIATFDPNTGAIVDAAVKQGAPAQNMNVTQEGGVRTMAPAPGSPEAMEVEAKKSKALANLGSIDQKRTVVSQDIDEALNIARNVPVNGVFSLAEAIPGTPQADVAELLNTIEATIGFDALQEMRNNSPTGGALGSVTERELNLLTATLGSLKQRQSPPQFVRNLKRLKEQLANSSDALREAFEDDFGAIEGAAEEPAWEETGVAGAKIRLKSGS